MTRLQLALDFVDLDDAGRIVRQTSPYVDIYEIGTPLLLSEGMRAVRAIANASTGSEVLADTKIVDGGYREALSAFDAGAGLVTVLALAERATIEAVVSAASERGGRVVADLIAARDPLGAADAAVECGAWAVCVHRSTDTGSWGVSEARLVAEIKRRHAGLRIMVAGGLSLETLPEALAVHPDIVVAGRSIVEARDPADAARELKRLVSGEEGR